MKKLQTRLISFLTVVSLLLGMLASTGILLSAFADSVTMIQDFENGTAGFSEWLVGKKASWALEEDTPLADNASLMLKTSSGVGCYVNFPAEGVGAQNLALRLRIKGNTGVIRIGANGNDAHEKRADAATGYEELTISSFIFTDTAGNILPTVATYDGPWGGIRFAADFDGYVFIKNENAVDIQKINVGIFHGSTNAAGMTLYMDDFFTYTGTDYAALVREVSESAPVEDGPVVVMQNFEKGVADFTSWLPGNKASWGEEKLNALEGETSLLMKSTSGVGCYVNFPAAVGERNIIVRLKVTGNTGIIRIGANGNDAHEKRADAATGYEELTTSKFVATDLNGQALNGVVTYDAAWGGFRFAADFDGYLFLENENNVNVQKVNLGIYHGSTNAAGMVLLWDTLAACTETDCEQIVSRLQGGTGSGGNGGNGSAAVTTAQDFENGTADFTEFLVSKNAKWELETTNPLSGAASLKMTSTKGSGCYVNFPAALGEVNFGFRLKVTGIEGILRVGANGNDAHEKRANAATGYEELTTDNFVFLDTAGNVLSNAAFYDTNWGGIRFRQAFDGYVLLNNDNHINVQKINLGIFHGSTNAEGMTLVMDNFFVYDTEDYKAIVGTFEEQPENVGLADKLQGFENGADGFASWITDEMNASWSLDTKAPLCSTTSLKLQSVNGGGSYVTFPAAGVGTKDLGLRLKVVGANGILRIGANGNDAHEKRADSATGYEELTLSNFVFTDAAGNLREDVAYYDPAWGGIRFEGNFNGYLFIKNENAIDIRSINVGIFHGSTNATGMQVWIDNMFTYNSDNYAQVLELVDEVPELTGDGVIQDLENGIKDFTAWLADSNASWKLEKKNPLAGTASLKLTSGLAAGCYVNFPGKIGVTNLAVRVKVQGDTGVIRIGANGVDAHNKRADSATGYEELTTTDIVFTDVNGNVINDAGYYDAPWGSIRFNGSFDGYVFLRNEKGIDIQVVNVGIFHGSTNSDGYTVLFDNFYAYSEHTAANFAAIAAELNRDVPAPEAATLTSGVEGVPAGTKDDLISDAFDGSVLDAKKWQGTATLVDGAAQIPAEGILSVYGQRVEAQRPAYFKVDYQTVTNGTGLVLYNDNSHYIKVYYENNAWYYVACAGRAEEKATLQTKPFTAGAVAIVYDGAQAIVYIKNKKVAEMPLPNGWDGVRQYRVQLVGSSTVKDLYVAGGVYTYTGRDEGMSDNFDGATFDENKWSIAEIGYNMSDASFGHPGTLAPSLQDGRLVVSGEPDGMGSWAGITLYTTQTQSPTVYNPVTFEVTRVSTAFQAGNPAAVTSGLGIYVNEQNFFQFALNTWSPAKWQWAGMLNGVRFAAEVHSSGSTNTTAYRFKLVYDGKTIQCYVDGYMVATVNFDVNGMDVHGSLLVSPSNPAVSPCEVSVTYDDFVTTGLVANAPSTAEEQAATITAITQPSRRDKAVSLPQMAAGFTATLVNIQPAGYLTESGLILKRDTKDVTITAQVKVYGERNDHSVVTAPMTILLQKAYTPAIVHDELAAGELPNQILGGEVIKGLQNPFIDETRMRLPCTAYVWTSPDNDLFCPELPEGFSSALAGSSDLSVIALDGTVVPPAKETEVTLKLKITNDTTGESDTRSYKVTVPAKSGHAEWDSYKDNQMGMFLHYMNGQLYADGSKVATNNEMAEAFDAEAVAEYAAKWDMDYVQLTAWHGDLITLYPSEVQKAYGMNRYTERDVIGDLLDALDAVNKKYGKDIELYLYTHPGQGTALHAIDQTSVGWGDYDKYNTYLAELYYELVSRFTNRENGKMGISGLYFDEGSPQGDMDLFINYPRLRDACKRAYSDLVLIQNLYQGNLYSQDVANHEVCPGTTYSVSFMTDDGTLWEACDNGGYSITPTGAWFPTAKVAEESLITSQYTLSNMFKFMALLASVNTEGGGVAWSFGNYAQAANKPDQLWETGVDEAMTALSAYYTKYRESLYGTVPGKAFPTPNAGGVTSLKRLLLTGDNPWGVTTDSKDGKTTYLHVLFAPKDNTLDLSAPANGVTFNSATLLGGDAEIKMVKTAEGGYRLILPQGFVWDEVDTVIALSVGSDEQLGALEDEKEVIDFSKTPVVLKDGKAYILEGTTYAAMYAFLTADEAYYASFISEDGLDEIDDTCDEWEQAAVEGMILRLITADFSEMTDYVITYYREEAVEDETENGESGENGENGESSSPDTGDKNGRMAALWLCLFSAAVLVWMQVQKKHKTAK